MEKTHFFVVPTGKTVPCRKCGGEADLVIVVDSEGCACSHAQEAQDALTAFEQDFAILCSMLGPIL